MMLIKEKKKTTNQQPDRSGKDEANLTPTRPSELTNFTKGTEY